MIVDDEPQILQGLMNQVDWELYNLQIDFASTNGYEALKRLPDPSVKLIITDAKMSGIDGFTLISTAKKLQPDLRFIMVSAYSEFNLVKNALHLGVENYLLKPINDEELHETLIKTLENIERDRYNINKTPADWFAFRSNVLDRWIHGNIHEIELAERAEILQINLTAKEYSVSLINLDKIDDLSNKIVICSKLLNQLREKLPQDNSNECFVDSQFRIVIISNGDHLKTRLKHFESVLTEVIVEVLGDKFQVFTVLGPIVTSHIEVPKSYKIASLYRLYTFLDPDTVLVNCNNHPGFLIENIYSSLNTFSKLIQEGDAMKLQQHFYDILTPIMNLSMEKINLHFMPFLLTLIHTIHESGRITEPFPKNIYMTLAEFRNVKQINQLKKLIPDMIQQAMKIIHERNESFHQLVRLSLQYTNDHYMNEISLKTISYELSVNPAYLGQLFKEETGKYFNDYLTDLRMQKSLTFLLKSNKKISEIAEKIGIPNQSYFNRLFKKKFGISPMEYRRQGKTD
jgi:two-component system response regulator YesN